MGGAYRFTNILQGEIREIDSDLSARMDGVCVLY